jgi:GTP:adenosylcobinamide-phosphate guanylyltransferase
MSHTAVLLAGQRPGTDPLAAHFGLQTKALIPIAGEPMVCRPARALAGSETVGAIVVLAQDVEAVEEALAGIPKISVRPSGATIAESLLALCRDPTVKWPIVVTTADHALLTPAMVAQICASDAGIAIGVVTRAAVQRRLPKVRRTWLAFRGEQVTGANLFVLASPKVAPAIELWRSVEQDRKKVWRILSLLGPFMLTMAALRLLGLNEALDRLSVKLRLSITAVRLDDPLAGVDVDSVEDHRLVEDIIAGRV